MTCIPFAVGDWMCTGLVDVAVAHSKDTWGESCSEDACKQIASGMPCLAVKPRAVCRPARP